MRFSGVSPNMELCGEHAETAKYGNSQYGIIVNVIVDIRINNDMKIIMHIDINMNIEILIIFMSLFWDNYYNYGVAIITLISNLNVKNEIKVGITLDPTQCEVTGALLGCSMGHDRY